MHRSQLASVTYTSTRGRRELHGPGDRVNRVRRHLTGIALFSVAALWTAAPAHADVRHHHRHDFMPVKGLVTSVSGSSIHVQTSTGSVAVGLSATTTVTRLVMGSTADLAKGQQIDAQLTIPGGTVIKSIHIELPPSHNSPAKQDSTRLDRTRHRLAHLDGARLDSRTAEPSPTVTGQIVAIGSSSITVRLRQGSTASYGLASNLSVTKTMADRAGDLAFGETVFAWVSRTSGIASWVTILRS